MFGLAFAALALLSASSIMSDPRFTAAPAVPATSAASQPAELAALTGRLQAHVRRLAGEIGERNVFHPQALRAAADYLRAQWASQGYPALMVTDTAFYRYAHYHRHRDTPDQLNYPAMARVVMVLQAALTAMASRRGRSQ